MYPQAVLSFTLPSGEKKAVALSPSDPILIGRNRSSTIKLNLPSVSRSHAKISFEREAFWIEDLGSSNGTFVNQKQVQKSRISIGDVLKCGDFVIAVRNGSERSSLPPAQNAKTDSAPAGAIGFDHTTNIGRRRESLPPVSSVRPSAKPVQTNPWHSKAPTHGPEEPFGNPMSPPTVNDHPQSRPREEGLSAAFSNSKLRTGDHMGDLVSNQSDSLQSPFTKTSEEENTELMRLRIIEKQLTDELNFQVNTIEQLQLQSQEYQERIANLESELDHRTQQFSQLRQSALNAEQETEESLHAAHAEIESLRDHSAELEVKLDELKQRLISQERDFARELELIEEEKKVLQVSSEDLSLKTEFLEEIESLKLRNEQLKEENNQLKDEVRVPRDSTAIHVFSLPRPNHESTNPEWSRHQAKFEQMIDELSYFQRRNRELEEQVNMLKSHQPNVDSSTALIQRTIATTSSQSSMSDLSASELNIHNSVESSPDEPDSDDEPTSSTNTRRAWRGML